MNSATHKREANWFDTVEPHLARGPFARWPHVADGALAILVFGVSAVAVAVSALDDGEEFSTAAIGDVPAAGFVLLGLAAISLLWRRARSIAVTTCVLGIMIGWAFAGYGDGHDLALVVAAYSVGRYTTDHRHSLAAVSAAVAVSIIGTIIDSHQRVDIAPAIMLVVLPWYVGRRIRNRGDYMVLLQERAERLEADQLVRARQAVVDERTRIARELHDVVAHRVSMMTVQAGAAKTVARDDLDAAIEAMGDVEQAGRQALGELRHLLGVLRPDVADLDDLGPQPGLAGLATLTEELAHTGARVTSTIAAQSSDVPIAVDLSAYRIVQESLTNIVKHAGANPTVSVTVTLEDGDLLIDVTNSTISNSVVTAPSGLPVSGYGIAGMRERAQLLGGTLVAEPQSPECFRVHARLPLDLEPT